jgi:hypothetical protein
MQHQEAKRIIKTLEQRLQAHIDHTRRLIDGPLPELKVAPFDQLPPFEQQPSIQSAVHKESLELRRTLEMKLAGNRYAKINATRG